MTRPLAAVKSGRKSLAEHQVHVFKRMDEAVAAVPLPAPLALACRSGCSYCCHYHVYVTAPEALVLGAQVRQMPDRARAEVTARLQGNADLATQLGRDAHIATNVRCAFLSEAGECGVYELRPAACRRHHSFDVTPCRVTFDDPTRTDELKASPDRLVAIEVIRNADLLASLQTNVDALRYEMNGAVLEAVTSDQALKRWMNGQVTFPNVSDRVHPMNPEN